jgi:hypothetical protein
MEAPDADCTFVRDKMTSSKQQSTPRQTVAALVRKHDAVLGFRFVIQTVLPALLGSCDGWQCSRKRRLNDMVIPLSVGYLELFRLSGSA